MVASIPGGGSEVESRIVTDAECVKWLRAFEQHEVGYLILSRMTDSALLHVCQTLRGWMIEYDDGSTVVLKRLTDEAA